MENSSSENDLQPVNGLEEETWLPKKKRRVWKQFTQNLNKLSNGTDPSKLLEEYLKSKEC